MRMKECYRGTGTEWAKRGHYLFSHNPKGLQQSVKIEFTATEINGISFIFLKTLNEECLHETAKEKKSCRR